MNHRNQFTKTQLAMAVATVFSAGTFIQNASAACTVDGTTYTVNTNLDVISQTPSVVTLRQAILDANADPNCDIINFDSSLNGQTITLDPQANNGGLIITEDVNIVGPGSDKLTITQPSTNAGPIFADSALNINSGDIDISGITFDGLGSSDDAGLAAIFNGGGDPLTFIADDIVVQNVTNGIDNGDTGLVVSADSAQITNSRFSNNFREGLAIFTNIIVIENVESRDNKGSGIRTSGNSSLSIKNSKITGNETQFNKGGGINLSIFTGTATIENTTIDDNRSNSGGGGIYISANGGAAVTILNSTISNNNSANQDFVTNLTDGAGAGIYVAESFTVGPGYDLVIRQSTISGNTSNSTGGGIFIDDSISSNSTNTININHSTITANTAEYSGGIYAIVGGSNINLSHTIVAGNMGNIQDPDIGVTDALGNQAANVIADFSYIGVNGINVTDPSPRSFLNAGDPMLDVLADGIGTGATQIHVPKTGSPVIDVGDPTLTAGTGNTPATDQDERNRVVNSIIDIGAVEFNGNLPPVKDSDITAATGNVDGAFSINLDDFFSDPNGDELNYSILNPAEIPGSISITGSLVAGTFVAADEGVYTVNYQACDAEPLCVTGSGNLSVEAALPAPDPDPDDSGSSSSSGGGSQSPWILLLLTSLFGLFRIKRKS